jgi:hypothetical protein
MMDDFGLLALLIPLVSLMRRVCMGCLVCLFRIVGCFWRTEGSVWIVQAGSLLRDGVD